MEKPYKVIWKYKNDNRYPQYHTYIFIGNHRPELDSILKKIQNLNLFETFVQLTNQEIKKLETAYGDRWYKCFFNMYHSTFMISQIQSNDTMSRELKTKMGQDWFDKHIKSQKLAEKKILYSYSAVIKDERNRKTVKKGRMMAITDDEGNMDYKISKNMDVQSLLSSKKVERPKPESTDDSTKKISRSKKSVKDYESEDDSVDETVPTKGGSSSKRKTSKKTINSRATIADVDSELIDRDSPDTDLDLLSTSADDAESLITDTDELDKNMDLDESYDENTESVLVGGRTIKRGLFYDWESGNYFRLNTIRFRFHKSLAEDDYKSIPEGERLRYDEIPDNADLDEYPDESRLAVNRKRVLNAIPKRQRFQSGGGDDDDDDEDRNSYDNIDQDEDEVEVDDGADDVYEDDGPDDVIEDEDRDLESDDERVPGKKAEKGEDDDEFNTGVDYDVFKDEDMDMDEIEKLYQQEDVEFDTDVSHTSDMIKKALNDDSLFKRMDKNMIDFDQEKDTSIYVEKLKNVYNKFYVKSQFIFGDDTIKDVKNKICCAIKNNKKFGDYTYIAPSRQYLWSEYIYNNNIEKVMIGQKWLRRNELLDVDIEPDNRMYMYEQLKDKLNTLRHNIRKFGNKIRREDDENNILYDYENYVTDNELYMIDVYNELGKGYKPDQEVLKNLEDVYMKLYFPKLRKEDIKNIVDYLNGDVKAEGTKIHNVYENINNDLIMENEIVHLVEEVKSSEKFDQIFKDNYVTQSVIHVNLRIASGTKLDMYRIFNEFQTNVDYPYIQYQTIERGGDYKYDEAEIYNYVKDKDNLEVLYKWFENAPYGISFKVKIKDKRAGNKDKFMSIGLNESGRIEYKTQWQESDGATIDDIKETYVYVKNLIEKINKESPRNKIVVPDDEEFKYAFINTIQKFELPEKFIVNHNDLSEFSRFFYPYVALVIEPRKRQAKAPKANDKSKFGTYLRYKRVSKYENQARLEQRIIFFLRNYAFQDAQLASELAKQFNITEEKALEEIQKTRTKYPNLKKSRKVPKNLENVPKYKPPGIGIDVQGKQRERYKIRISGARNKEQLNRIITFMNILIHLYIETYLYKKKERQIIKEKLKKLTNIAKRRSKVDELVDYSKETKTVKQMTQIDKRRIGFKPERGQNQWTRSCQNSGNDKKRRPQQYSATTMDQLIKRGYQYNKKTDVFEKKFIVSRGKKKEEVLIRTIKLPEYDDNGENTGNYIHYACDPEENGTHMYIGFLTRSANPFGHCMPCCFKKDPSASNNKSKKAFFDSCLGKGVDDVKDSKAQKSVGDKLYILQDTNKIQEGRFAFLPKYLDRYFNYMLDKNKKIRLHYLEQTINGYFFKYGSKQTEYQFLNAIAATLNTDIGAIKKAIVTTIENDRTEQVFTSLNCGDIKTQFGTRENYINFINSSNYLDFLMTKDIICIPGVLTKGGLNLVVFHKREIRIKKTLEKERVIEDFYLDCTDLESHYTIKDPSYSTVFMIRDNKNYYPIVLVKKEDKTSKTIDTEKAFKYADDPKNIVYHISDFFNRNCSGSFAESAMNRRTSTNAKKTSHLLKILGKDYVPKYQVIDVRNKCKYLITNKGVLLPVKPSGAPWDVQIIKNFDRYIVGFEETYKNLMEIYLKSNKQITVKPIGVYYESKKGDIIKVNSIMTKTKDVVPVIPETVDISKIKSMSMIFEKKPLNDTIDDEILKGEKNFKVDDRIVKVNENMFIEESYQLFRLEFSNYINKEENSFYKTKFEKLMNSPVPKSTKVDKIRLLLYKIIDKTLYDKYMELLNIRDDDRDDEEQQKGGQKGGTRYNPKTYARVLEQMYSNASHQTTSSRVTIVDPRVPQTLVGQLGGQFNGQFIDKADQVDQIGGKINKLVHRIGKLPSLVAYQVNNDRRVCEVHEDRSQCNNNPHCRWAHGNCYMGLTADMIVMFVNRISEELALNDMKAFEIMKVGDYFVSDIVDRNRFTYVPGQKIIRASSSNIRRTLQELFGRDNIPNIGKRKTQKATDVNYIELNLQNPVVDMIDVLIQKIIPNNITIFRAYANGYHWIKNNYYDSDSRNIGYYSPLQSDLANNFKALVIDWLSDPNKQAKISQEMINNMGVRKASADPVREFINRLSNDVVTTSNGITELMVVTKINNDIPVIIRNDTDKVIHIFDAGRHTENPDSATIAKYDPKKCVNLRYEYVGNSSVPDIIEVVYYKDS
ncbi:early transcription factor VETF large subunit [Yasminevirus sp. GU-2018]|uniref:Early transcription factor VETF large subunit n=1 Tax=Yasminevirus sp. GU-2018 TaxID=2420051 RepID=A0A5K0U942_9VIRU|nr:early transcription factor VETF large subunit [Yasminevirus sp. GU-2018]